MNKISSISEANPIFHQQNINKPSDHSFKNSLHKAFEKTGVSETQKSHTESLEEIKPATFEIVEYSPAHFINKTSKLIDMLDTYVKDIENPEKSLKEIEPIIDIIENNASQLIDETEESFPHDADLKKIVTECVMTAKAEYIKFKRGDYI